MLKHVVHMVTTAFQGANNNIILYKCHIGQHDIAIQTADFLKKNAHRYCECSC